MAVHPKDIIEYNEKMIKVLKDGYGAIHNHNLVDIREYPDAELFYPKAVKKIIKDLEKENEQYRIDLKSYE